MVAVDGPRRLHQVDDLNRYYGNAGTAALALKDQIFRRKAYLPKAYNFHVQTPGNLNWRMTHARRRFTRCGAYVYICPVCKGNVASDVKTGKIDHRTVCGSQFSVKDGVVKEKGGKRQAGTPRRSD